MLNSYSLAKALSLLLLLGGDVESNPGPSREWLRKQAMRQHYLLQREETLVKRRLDYAESPEPKRLASKAHYTANPEAKKRASKASYYADPEVKKAAVKAQYYADPESKKAAAKARYTADPDSKKTAAREHYKCKPGVAKAASRANYVKRRWVKIAASKANYQQKKLQVNFYRRGKYALNEPKAYNRHKYAVELQRKLFSKPSLRLHLRKGFTQNDESLAQKMSKGVTTNSLQTHCKKTC